MTDARAVCAASNGAESRPGPPPPASGCVREAALASVRDAAWSSVATGVTYGDGETRLSRAQLRICVRMHACVPRVMCASDAWRDACRRSRARPQALRRGAGGLDYDQPGTRSAGVLAAGSGS